jgi:hypothetical protein
VGLVVAVVAVGLVVVEVVEVVVEHCYLLIHTRNKYLIVHQTFFFLYPTIKN